MQFIVEVEGEQGESAFVRIDAASGAQAVENAKRLGHQVIALRTDNSLTGDLTVRNAEARAILASMSAEDQVRLAEGGLAGWMSGVKLIARALWWTIALAVGAAYVQYLLNGAVGWLAWVAGATLLVPFAGAALVNWFGPSNDHVAYHQAFFDGRWDDALAHLERFRAHVDDFTYAHMRASVLAARGEHDEAMQLLKPFEGEVPDLAFATQAAMLCERNRDYEGSFAWNERALDAQPDNPSVLLDLAQKRAVIAGDLEGAEAYLARVDRASLTPEMQFGVEMGDGVLALERGELTEARALLEGVVAELGGRQPRALYAGLLVVVRLYLAETYARSGEVEFARAHYDAVRDAARLHALEFLTDRVDAALRR